jgi:hypothetical protein
MVGGGGGHSFKVAACGKWSTLKWLHGLAYAHSVGHLTLYDHWPLLTPKKYCQFSPLYSLFSSGQVVSQWSAIRYYTVANCGAKAQMCQWSAIRYYTVANCGAKALMCQWSAIRYYTLANCGAKAQWVSGQVSVCQMSRGQVSVVISSLHVYRPKCH